MHELIQEAASTQGKQPINKTSKAGTLEEAKQGYFIHDCILKGLAHDSQIIHEFSIFKCKLQGCLKGRKSNTHPLVPFCYLGKGLSPLRGSPVPQYRSLIPERKVCSLGRQNSLLLTVATAPGQSEPKIVPTTRISAPAAC